MPAPNSPGELKVNCNAASTLSSATISQLIASQSLGVGQGTHEGDESITVVPCITVLVMTTGLSRSSTYKISDE